MTRPLPPSITGNWGDQPTLAQRAARAEADTLAIISEPCRYNPPCKFHIAYAAGRADERQRIRQLAIDVRAFYVTHEMPNWTASQHQPIGHAFADLLGDTDE